MWEFEVDRLTARAAGGVPLGIKVRGTLYRAMPPNQPTGGWPSISTFRTARKLALRSSAPVLSLRVRSCEKSGHRLLPRAARKRTYRERIWVAYEPQPWSTSSVDSLEAVAFTGQGQTGSCSFPSPFDGAKEKAPAIKAGASQIS